MRKQIIFFLMILMLCSVSFASIGFTNQSYPLWASVTNGVNFYPSGDAHITIFDDEQNIVVDNQTMVNVAVGLYSYNFTPTYSGEYYTYTQFLNTSGDIIAIGDETFNIIDLNTTQINNIGDDAQMFSIIFGLIILALVFAYSGIKVFNNNHPEYKVELQIVGATLVSFCSVIFWVILYLLMALSEGQVYYNVVKAVFIFYTIVFGLITTLGALALSIILVILLFRRFIVGEK
jgi:hypothetical protein